MKTPLLAKNPRPTVGAIALVLVLTALGGAPVCAAPAPPAAAAAQEADSLEDEATPEETKPKPKPKAKPAKAKPAPKVEVDDEEVVAESGPARTWYHPSRADSELPWNDHDPWGSSWRASLYLATHTMTPLGDTRTAFAKTGSLSGVEVGRGAFALRLGTYMPNSVLAVGIGWSYFGTTVLKDFGLPDMQIGLTFGSLMAQWVPHFDTVGMEVRPVAARLTYEDFVVLDAGLLVGGWVRPTTSAVAYSYGLSLGAGVAF